jgi:hypothetical protein
VGALRRDSATVRCTAGHHLEQLGGGQMIRCAVAGRAHVDLPGLALASAMNSGTVMARDDVCPTSLARRRLAVERE